MEIKTLICDLDGTLLAPSGGVLVSDRVRDALIALQEQGMTIVLASARIFQGVLPLARQLQMDRYHGYIIAQNGTLGYDCLLYTSGGFQHPDRVELLCQRTSAEAVFLLSEA